MNLAPRALYEEVAEQLRQRIFGNALPPGTWIDELKLAAELGISRTPMREALKVLAAEGLVTMRVRRGAYVAETSDKDLRDVYHLLSLLESDAVASLAQRVTESELAELESLHLALTRAAQLGPANSVEFFALNEQFHVRVLVLADNPWRLNMVTDLRKLMKLHRHNSLLRQGRIDESLAEHEAIMQALRARDPKRATQAMHTHFDNGLEAAAPAVAATPAASPAT